MSRTRADNPSDKEVVDDLLLVLQSMHAVGTPAICQMDVSMSQVKAMLTVSMEGEATVGHIARVMGVGQPAASVVVDRLVHLGWVERTEDPGDRRRVLVRLTHTGRDQIETVWRLRRDLLATWINRLGEDDFVALGRGIAALRHVATSEAQLEPVAG